MADVVFGAEAARLGLDDLGLPSSLATWCFRGEEAVGAAMEERSRLAKQCARQLQRLGTLPTPAQQASLEEECALLMRPAYTVSMSGYGGGAAQEWRQQAGLRGAESLGQAELVTLAQHARHGMAC